MHEHRKQRTGSYGPAEPIRKKGRACSVEGCARPNRIQGLCEMHWKRLRDHGTLGLEPRQCAAEGCDNAIPADRRIDAKFCSQDCMARSQNPATRFAYNLSRMGLTVERYEAMLEAQGGVCALNGCDASVGESDGRRLAVDHDRRCCPGRYSCGNCIRGLLCGAHNTGIGKFGDDVDALRAAIEYLERYEMKSRHLRTA